MDEHGRDPGEQHSEEEVCSFCGGLPEGAVLVRGATGAICSTCVFSLSVRLAEAEREGVDPTQASRPDEALGSQVTDGDLPAHEYEHMLDLAAAYQELGKRAAAMEQLFKALEGSLACGDWRFALRTVARIRALADGPTVRDRIHDVLAMYVPPDEERREPEEERGGHAERGKGALGGESNS